MGVVGANPRQPLDLLARYYVGDIGFTPIAVARVTAARVAGEWALVLIGQTGEAVTVLIDERLVQTGRSWRQLSSRRRLHHRYYHSRGR